MAGIETALAYDFWCSMWLLSNAVGRTLTVPRPQAPVFLNLYAVICAESGVTRKSTAVRHATTILRAYATDMSVMSGGIGSEPFDELLASLTNEHGKSHLAISSSELVTMLGRERYTTAIPGKLTDLYDCPDIHTRTSTRQGNLVAREVYVTLIAASTPSWLVRAVSPDVVEGGFTSRCLFIIEERPKHLIAWPDDSAQETFTSSTVEKLKKVNAEAIYVHGRMGGIRPTASALREFRDWYEHRAMSNDPYGASFQAREDHHVLRTAALLSVSDNLWEIQQHHIVRAIDIISHVRRSGLALFGSGIAASRTYSVVDRVRHALMGAGRTGLTQTALTAMCRGLATREEQASVLAVMHEMELIQKFIVETNDKGRPTTMWRGTRALTSEKALDDVVDTINPPQE